VARGPKSTKTAAMFIRRSIEIGPHVSRPHGISLRAGRQEIVLGSGRLFDNNEGPNVKLSFDGVRAIAETAHVRLDLFAMKPVENDLGWFGDVPNHAQSVWGSYLTVPAPIVSRGQADFYYIGLDTKSVTYGRGTAQELRHTVGTRVFRPIGKGLDYNWEANYQWGSLRERLDPRLERVNRNWIYIGPPALSSPAAVTGGRIQRRPESSESDSRNLQLSFPPWRILLPQSGAFPGAPESDRFAPGGAISAEDERYGRSCLELVLAGIDA
jgi:hypothetical protein